MIENEDPREQMPGQKKLVLPAYPDEESRAYSDSQLPQVRPDQLIRHKAKPAPKNLLAKIGYYWRKDPAYKVLIIATAMVIVAGLTFVSLATAAFIRDPNFFGSNNTVPQNPTGSSPSGTVDLHPTFPTPGGGSGSNSSSQPPPRSTPILQTTGTSTGSTTPTPQSSPTPGSGGGNLTVEITNIPGQVNNNSTVLVGVTTNEAGATVRLQVYYNVYPFYYQSGAQVTDGNGNATLDWNVQVTGSRGRHVIAKVTAIATDQNGQYATSATYTVQVLVLFGGGPVL